MAEYDSKHLPIARATSDVQIQLDRIDPEPRPTRICAAKPESQITVGPVFFGILVLSVVSLIVEYPADGCRKFNLWVYVLVRTVILFHVYSEKPQDVMGELITSVGCAAAGVAVLVTMPACLPRELLFTTTIVYVGLDCVISVLMFRLK
jgi:hypothetical protein